MSLTFTVGGKTMTAAQVEAKESMRQKSPVAKKEAPKRVFQQADAGELRGYRVNGYPPGTDANVTGDLYKDACTKQFEPGGKPAGSLEEFARRWYAKNKPKSLRSKPYELEDAAEQCAEMARKAGWERVTVEPLLYAKEQKALFA